MSASNGSSSRNGSFVASIREFFTLRETRAARAALAAEDAAAIARLVAVAEQRNAAAEALHFQSHRVEALRLVKEALTVATEAAVRYAAARAIEPQDRSAILRTLEQRGIAPSLAAEVDASATSTAAIAVPELDVELAIETDEDFARARDATETIVRELAFVGSEPSSLLTRSRLRIATSLFAVLAVATLGYYASRTPLRLRATGSAPLHPSFAPEFAVDGRDDTRFLLPNDATGYLDLQVSPRRRISGITLLNSVNEPYNDRSTKDYAIEVYARGRLAKRITGSFAYTLHPERVRHPVGVDQVDRIRVLVLSHHRTGGGFSEIEAD